MLHYTEPKKLDKKKAHKKIFESHLEREIK